MESKKESGELNDANNNNMLENMLILVEVKPTKNQLKDDDIETNFEVINNVIGQLATNLNSPEMIERFYQIHELDYLYPHLSSNNFYRDSKLVQKQLCGFRKHYYDYVPIMSITEYQPFFPETFYQYWEALMLNYQVMFADDKSPVDMLYVTNSCKNLGGLEAFIKFRETYYVDYYLDICVWHAKLRLTDSNNKLHFFNAYDA